MPFVRGCTFAPTVGACGTAIRNQSSLSAVALSGLADGALPELWIASPRNHILYYPVLREDANIFAYDVPQGCNPGGSGTPPCKLDGEITDLFALGASAVWATATRDAVLTFDGNAWSRLAIPAAAGDRDFLTVFAANRPIGNAGEVPVAHFIARQATDDGGRLDYSVRVGDVWNGPFPLVHFGSTARPLYQVFDAHGCAWDEPLFVGSAPDSSGQVRGLVLAPLLRPF